MTAFPFRVTRFAAMLAAAMTLTSVTLPIASAQPSPTGCTLAPLTLPLFDGTPAARIAATPVASEAESGADPGTIRRAVEVIVACINSGDPAYQFAIFTERYLAAQLVDPSVTNQAEFERELSLGPSLNAETFDLIDVSGVERRDDGRVEVVVELAAGGATYRDTLLLANVGGVWRIDAVEEFDPPR